MTSCDDFIRAEVKRQIADIPREESSFGGKTIAVAVAGWLFVAWWCWQNESKHQSAKLQIDRLEGMIIETREYGGWATRPLPPLPPLPVEQCVPDPEILKEELPAPAPSGL